MALNGKSCPVINGLTFIKGDAVAVPTRTGPMVIEFWATWCGPCRAAFPHLSQLARQHRASGLVVLGVSMEQDSPQLRAFVAQQGDKMDYRVAADGSGAAAQALLGAAGVSGIPHAFIVDAGGTVRHHGHPMEPQFAQALQRVCATGGSGGSPAAPAQQQQRELLPVTSSREELMALPVRQLKALLDERRIGYADLSEKGELADRIVERCSRVTYYAAAG